MTDIPDYTTMNGGEFRRAVGTDPEKWAVAFMQRMAIYDAPPPRHVVASWFAGAMAAARREVSVTLHDISPPG